MRMLRLTASLSEAGGWRLVRRYARFCVVGGSGLVVDMALLHLLASPGLLGWNLSLSKALAAEAGLVNNFIWNELWTFRDLAQDGAVPAGSGVETKAGQAAVSDRLKELNRLKRLHGLNRVASVRSTGLDLRSSMPHAGQSSLLPRGSLRARVRRFVKFNLICTAGIGLSVLLLNGQVYGLGWNVYLANFNAIVLVSLWNFWLNWRFGWGGPASQPQP